MCNVGGESITSHTPARVFRQRCPKLLRSASRDDWLTMTQRANVHSQKTDRELKANAWHEKTLLAKPRRRLDKSHPAGSMSVLRLPVCFVIFNSACARLIWIRDRGLNVSVSARCLKYMSQCALRCFQFPTGHRVHIVRAFCYHLNLCI